MELLNLTDEEIQSLSSLPIALTMFVFALVGGLVGDRVSKSAALACFTAFPVVGWAVMIFVGNLPAMYFFAVAVGVSQGGFFPIIVAMIADYFGTKSLATILGLSGLFSGLTAIIGIIFIESLYNSLGDWAGFLVPAGVVLTGAFCFWKARAPRPPATADSQAALEQENDG